MIIPFYFNILLRFLINFLRIIFIKIKASNDTPGEAKQNPTDFILEKQNTEVPSIIEDKE